MEKLKVKLLFLNTGNPVKNVQYRKPKIVAVVDWWSLDKVHLCNLTSTKNLEIVVSFLLSIGLIVATILLFSIKGINFGSVLSSHY